MKVIGICGSSGSGKSTVCEFFRKRGVPVFDCDEIYHELVNTPSDCLFEIGKAFGTGVIADGKLDRAALGEIVFHDKKKRLQLNEIAHRHVVLKLKSLIKDSENSGEEFCLIDAPLLFEAGLERICNLVCSVISSENEQIRRICLRDGISEEKARLRISNQISKEELMKRSDVVIENNGNITDLERYCYILLEKIYELEEIENV